MKTLHDNDAGYLSFYKDVINEVEKIRHKFDIPNIIPSENIVNECEFWIEEIFFEPEFNDNVLAIHAANIVLSLFEDINYTHSVNK